MHLKKVKLGELISLITLIVTIIVATNIYLSNINTPWQHFSDQAQSFLDGRLDLVPLSFDKHDYVIKNGKYYWHEGPFPSIVLLPFQILFGPNFHQGFMQILLIFLLIFFLFKLAILKKFNTLSSFYLVSAFLFGSPIVGVVLDPKSWFFSQTVAVTTLAWLILELETTKRWWLMGILNGSLLATRPTSAFILIALITVIFKQKVFSKNKWINLLKLLTPILICGLLLMWFNYARFGSPLDNGYLTNDVGGYMSPLRDLGLFSLNHIPTNIYYYFLSSVEPVSSGISAHLKFPFIKYNVWGLSFILIAPFFLYSLKSLRNYSNYLRSLWLVIAITMFVLLSYYATGWYQFGPRYTADFMPILYLLTLYSLKPPALTRFQKIVINISCLLNIYLLITSMFFHS